MTRRISELLMALLALGTLTIFLGILIYRVPRLDLGVLTAVTLLLVLYDFFLSPSRGGHS